MVAFILHDAPINYVYVSGLFGIRILMNDFIVNSPFYLYVEIIYLLAMQIMREGVIIIIYFVRYLYHIIVNTSPPTPHHTLAGSVANWMSSLDAGSYHSSSFSCFSSWCPRCLFLYCVIYYIGGNNVYI